MAPCVIAKDTGQLYGDVFQVKTPINAAVKSTPGPASSMEPEESRHHQQSTLRHIDYHFTPFML